MSDEREINFLGDVQRLALAPDDILVLSTPRSLPLASVEHLRESLKSIVGEERKIMILTEGLKVGVLAPESD